MTESIVEYEGAGQRDERFDKLERTVYRELWLWRVAFICGLILTLGSWLVCFFVLDMRNLL